MKPRIQLNCGRQSASLDYGNIVPLRRPTLRPIGRLDHDLSVSERGTTGPVPIGELLHPLQRIIAHPDRARLLAKFCENNL